MILILGDVHIGKSLNLGKAGIGETYNSRISDNIFLLNFVLETAIKNDVSNIIITGDVFEDQKPHHSLIKIFVDWLKKCEGEGISVDIIAGNHDVQKIGLNSFVSSLDIVNSLSIDDISFHKNFHTIMMEEDEVAITLFPFRDRKSLNLQTHAECFARISSMLNYEYTSIPKSYTKILIGHQAIIGSIPVGDEIDDITNELFFSPSFFKGYDYVWMGHIHKAQVMTKSPYVAHIGSMDLSDMGECGQEKHIVLFDTDSKKFTEIKLPTRKLNKIIATVPIEEDSTEYVIKFVKDNFEKNELENSICKIEVTLLSKNAQACNRKEIEKFLCSEYLVHNISNFSETRNFSVINTEDRVVTDSCIDVKGAIKVFANQIDSDEDIKNAFISAAIEIYEEYKIKNSEKP